MSKSPHSLYIHSTDDAGYAVAIKLPRPPGMSDSDPLPFQILSKTFADVADALIERAKLTRVANSLLLQGRLPALAFSELELRLLKRLLNDHITDTSSNATAKRAETILAKLKLPVTSPAP